jgi:hypothetical protein
MCITFIITTKGNNDTATFYISIREFEGIVPLIFILGIEIQIEIRPGADRGWLVIFIGTANLLFCSVDCHPEKVW